MSFYQESCHQHNHTEIIQQLHQFQFHFSMTKRMKIVDNMFYAACGLYCKHILIIIWQLSWMTPVL
jgi:hypothetical protein